jgi:hypothetical protein
LYQALADGIRVALLSFMPLRTVFLAMFFCALCLALSCARIVAASATTEPRCDGILSEQLEQAVVEQGGTKTFTYFPRGEVEGQFARYPGSLCPRAAVGIAVGALLRDRGPEALAMVGRDRGVLDCDARCLFNRSSSLFGIVADQESKLENRLLPNAPALSSLRTHWVFFLSVADLSEHGYWALVARDGSGVEIRSEN